MAMPNVMKVGKKNAEAPAVSMMLPVASPMSVNFMVVVPCSM